MKQQFCKNCGAKITNKTKVCPECHTKLKRSKLKIIIGTISSIFIILLLCIILSPTPTDGKSATASNSNKVTTKKTVASDKILTDNKTKVMYGYLGNFKDIHINEVLKASFNEVKWDSFKSDNKYVVEVNCKNKDISTKIQFLVRDKDFEIIYIDINGESFDNSEAEDSMVYLNSLYVEYYKSIGYPLNPDDPIDETVNKGTKGYR